MTSRYSSSLSITSCPPNHKAIPDNLNSYRITSKEGSETLERHNLFKSLGCILQAMNLIILTTLVLFIICSGVVIADTHSSKYWMDKARDYYSEESYDQALDCIDSALEINQNDVEALAIKGSILVRIGRSNDAISVLENALKQNQNNQEAWAAEGEAYHNLGNNREALECYNKSLNIDNTYAEGWYGKSLALKAVGKIVEAKSCYNKAISLDPSVAYKQPPQIDTSPTNSTTPIAAALSGCNGTPITWNFETGDLRGWNKTGDAFDYQPTYGDNSAANGRGHSGQEGKYWIGTYEMYPGPDRGFDPGSAQGSGPKGTLASVPFIVDGKSISFLLGGGKSCSVSLIVNGSTVLIANGRNNVTMERMEWNVSMYRGETAIIKLTDNDSSDWGYISFDDVRFDEPPRVCNGSVEIPLGAVIVPS
jgi:tetratricopeptide (TPR) repeat protein